MCGANTWHWVHGHDVGRTGCHQAKGRINYTYATDAEALDAFQELSRMEGIIPALETAHGLAYAKKIAPTMGKDQIIIVNLSGRGDKDVAEASLHIFGQELKF